MNGFGPEGFVEIKHARCNKGENTRMNSLSAVLSLSTLRHRKKGCSDGGEKDFKEKPEAILKIARRKKKRNQAIEQDLCHVVPKSSAATKGCVLPVGEIRVGLFPFSSTYRIDIDAVRQGRVCIWVHALGRD